jgi:hypothetical protein
MKFLTPEDYYLVAQFFGICGFLITAASGRVRTGTGIMMLTGTGNLLWVIHYYVLGFDFAALLNLVAAKRLILCAFLPFVMIPYIVVGTLILFVIISIITFTHIISIIPLIGSSLLTLSLLARHDVHIVRLGALAAPLAWTLYGFFTLSVVEIITNLFLVMACFYGLIRYDGVQAGMDKLRMRKGAVPS